MNRPLVSVVIAAWNASEYLPRTLESALGQSWPNLEIIVVDDGSTDRTAEVLAPFLSRIRYEVRQHLGLAAARNEGIRLARGEYIALLDADDLWEPEKIAVQVEIAARHPESGLVVCNGVEFDDDRVIRQTLLYEPLSDALADAASGEVTADFEHGMIANCCILCPSQVLIPRTVLNEIGPFADSQAQDYEYYLRVSGRYPITVHHHQLVRWRYRPDSMSGPRAERPIRVGFYVLSVLAAHRSRCRPQHRPVLETRIRGLTRSLAYQLMTRGRECGRLMATSQLMQILIAHPWPPTALLHLAGLWSPAIAFRVGARMTRPFRHRP